MQRAIDSVHEINSGTRNDKNSQDDYITTRKATITLLDDVTGAGFKIGLSTYSDKGDMATNQANLKDIHLTINLNGYTYAFNNPLTYTGTAKNKAIQILRNRPDSTSYVVINGGNGGTLKIADKTDGNFERLIRSYVDLTLNDVTLDGTKLQPESTGLNDATLCHSAGTLNITGSTTFLNQSGLAGNCYYDIAGKISNNTVFHNYYAGGLSIIVNTTGDVPNIGLAEWSGYVPDDFSKANLTITNGNVGSVALSETAVEKGGMNQVNITGGSFDTFETVASGEYYVAGPTGIDSILAVANHNIWNSDVSTSNKYNYLQLKSGSTTKEGEILISASNVANKDRLTPLVNMGEGKASLFGVPYDAKITWGANAATVVPNNYNLAYLNYNSGETVATVKTAKAGALIQSSVKGTANSGILATTIKEIDASSNEFAVTLKGHDNEDNTLRDGTGSDSLYSGTATATSLTGSVFYYNGGADSINGYTISDNAYDKVIFSSDIDAVTVADSVKAVANGSSSDLVIALGGANSLKFEGLGNVNSEVNGIKIQSGKTIYNYSNRSIADDDSITLTSNFNDATYRVSNYSKKVDASAVILAAGIAITGNDKDNNIIGSSAQKNTLYGGAGNDTLTGGTGADIFQYSDGKDFVEGYSFSGGDKASVTADDIISAKSTRKGLEFTFKDNSNVLTFSPVNEFDVEKVSLSSNGFLTKDGYIDKASAANFKLFSGTKGNIDLSDALYGSGVVSSIDASLTKNSVTLAGGGSAIKSLIFGANGKKDLFEYGGGSVTISGYETATDRIDIGEIGPIDLFEIKGDDVAISVGGTQKDIISLGSVKDKEVLIHDADSKGNSFSKFVFHADGVLYNKEKKPTEANIYSNVNNATAFTADDSIKKIFLQSGVHSVSIQSGDNKATLDASAAGASLSDDNQVGVSLIGGTNSNKFIGSDYADTFVYNGGKDMVNNFVSTGTGTADSIALADNFNIESAKITLSKKSIKFKFDSKNTLTLKGDSEIESLTANGKGYSYAKNAIVDGGQVSLTSQFSGTYKISKEDAGVIQYVYGDRVTKNLTFKGSDQGETFTGGQKKTTFKGGGGADSLVGGTGKDIFFYAKGDTGTTEINNFEFGVGKDRLKIANGTIGDISTISGGVKFAMTSGKKGDTSEIGYFELTKFKDKDNFDWKDVAIKANSTYYWFAQEAGEDISGNSYAAGDLITTTSKVTTRNVIACDIIDLGYSTNLVKSSVAFKVADSAFSFTGNKPTKKS